MDTLPIVLRLSKIKLSVNTLSELPYGALAGTARQDLSPQGVTPFSATDRGAVPYGARSVRCSSILLTRLGKTYPSAFSLRIPRLLVKKLLRAQKFPAHAGEVP